LVEVLEAGIDRPLVIGGDGTFSLAADVLALAGAGSRIPLGLVPAGTGSDLARTLGLPRDPLESARRALAGTPRPVDALELTFDDGRRRFAINVVSAGVSSGVVERINALESRGKAAYLTEAVKALLAYQPASCNIEVDGKPWHEGPLLLVAIANGTSFGGGMRIAPRAEVDDGLADLVLAPRVPGWQIPILLPRLYLGRHLSSRWVRYRRARTVRIEPAEGFPLFDLDGDSWAPGAVTIRVRSGAVRVAGTE
jgi:diacylglycerol kinase (ATP)